MENAACPASLRWVVAVASPMHPASGSAGWGEDAPLLAEQPSPHRSCFPGVRGVYHIYQSLIIDSAYLFAV